MQKWSEGIHIMIQSSVSKPGSLCTGQFLDDWFVFIVCYW
jgi:hypothetical protein